MLQIPDRMIIDDAGGPAVLVGGTVEAALNAALPLVGTRPLESDNRTSVLLAECSELCFAPVNAANLCESRSYGL